MPKPETIAQATQNLTFKVLVMDTARLAVSTSVDHVLHSIASNGRLANSAKVNTSTGTLAGGDVQYAVTETQGDSSAERPQSFIVSVFGPLEAVAGRRKPLIEHFERQGFKARYVLLDDVSESFARELYPLIYKVENALRGYLLQFMVTEVGPGWWDLTATSEQSQKAQQRKGNESFFGELIDSKSYLIDFGDLGRIVYKQSSGFKTKDEIVKRVLELEDDLEAVGQLKKDLQSNYIKFFKEAFKDRGISGCKWGGR